MPNKPVKKFRIGTLEIAEWAGQTQGGNTYSNFTITNSYKDKTTNEWKESNSFMFNDIQNLKTLCDKILLSRVKESAQGQAQGLNNQQFQQGANTEKVNNAFNGPWDNQNNDSNVPF